MDKYFASVTYQCKNRKGYSYKVTVDWLESANVKYGERKVLAIFDGVRVQTVDVRHDKRFATKEAFFENILNFLKEIYDMAESVMIEKSETRCVV